MMFKRVNKCYFLVLILIFFLAMTSFLSAQTLPTGERLRTLADKRGFLFGFALMGNFNSASDSAQYTTVAKREFNFLTCENAMKMDATHPSETSYNFSGGDQAVQFASANGMKVHAHCLIWHSQVPNWVGSYSGNVSKLTQVMNDYIDKVVGYWKGKVVVWDVANEIFNENGTYRSSVWYNTFGKSFIDLAFTRARQADATVKLIYNDYNIETINSKSTAAYNMIKDMKQRGIPIDGVGFQTHLTVDGIDYNSFAQNMQRFADIGCEIYITECDVRIPDNGPSSDLTKQADIYKNLMLKCLAQKACKGFQVWGITDAHSWVPGTFPGTGRALLFDNNYAPKSAYYAVQSAFGTVPTPPPSTSTPTPTNSVTLGDVNNDGAINIIDALLVAQYTVGTPVSPFNATAADVNKSGAIDIIDALLIAQYSVGLKNF